MGWYTQYTSNIRYITYKEKKYQQQQQLSVLFRHHINGILFTYIRYRSRQSTNGKRERSDKQK